MALPPAGARGRRRAQGAGSLAQTWRCAFLPRPRPLSSVLPAQPAAGSRGRRATPGAAAGLRSRPLLCVSEVKPENIPLQPFRGAVRPPGKAVHAEPRWVLAGAGGCARGAAAAGGRPGRSRDVTQMPTARWCDSCAVGSWAGPATCRPGPSPHQGWTLSHGPGCPAPARSAPLVPPAPPVSLLASGQWGSVWKRGGELLLQTSRLLRHWEAGGDSKACSFGAAMAGSRHRARQRRGVAGMWGS